MNYVKTSIKYLIVSVLLTSCYAQEVNGGNHFDSQTYHDNSQIQNKWAKEIIQNMSLSGNELILDIGSGDGRISALLSKFVPKGQVIGIDISEDMVNFASKNYPSPIYPNLDFKMQSADHFKFNKKFDYIVSFSTLHWVPKLNKVFDKIHENLKPQGKFILYFGPDFGENRLDHIIERVAVSDKWKNQLSDIKSGFYLISPQVINDMMIQSKLQPLILSIIRTHESFENVTAFKIWLKSCLPHLKNLSQNQYNEFLEDIVQQYVRFYPLDSDGKFHYYDYMIKIEGVNTKG